MVFGTERTLTESILWTPVHQVWPKPSCKGEEGKADRGRGGKTTSGMDRHGVRHVPEGSGEHGKMEETGCG